MQAKKPNNYTSSRGGAVAKQISQFEAVPLRSNEFASETSLRNKSFGTADTLVIATDTTAENIFREAVNDIDLKTKDDYNVGSDKTSLNTMISRMADGIVFQNTENCERALESEQLTPSQLVAPMVSNTISVEPLHFLGITHTNKNAALLIAFVKILTKYTVSLDGQPTPNYYNTYFVPWSLKSPLLTTLSIYTTAAIQSESLKIPPNKNPLVLSYKLAAIRLLKEKLQSKKGLDEQIGNEAICAVAILVSMEWYWSEFEVIEKHLKGLVEMIRLRGGLGELGLHEFLKRMILIIDYNIASTYDREPLMPHNMVILPRHPAFVMTPLLSSGGVTFLAHQEELGISEVTASILDNTRFLILSTIKTIDRLTTPQDHSKLQRTAFWTRDWLTSLPTDRDQDFVYQSCRVAAQIYCRAITEHTALSKECGVQDLTQLWGSLWRVSLTRWKQIPGIFLWILLSGLQTSEHTLYGRFLKSMIKGVMTYLAVEHWDVVDAASMGFVKLQRWLRKSGETEAEATKIGHIAALPSL
ncbi:hypothetical protein N431DRAFT_490268 [Stipitochalara longipes BDJ]|nr:hypothetical protein N431DRAFT_490268 [Stipitochalara longipes BDJ]